MEGNASLAYPSTPLGVVCVQPRQEGTRKKWLMRPFKLNRLVGTRFEEAAIRYAAEVRRAARFPPTSTSTSITTALTSHATTRSGQILASSLRHQYERPVDRRGSRVVPTQPVRPTVHVADPSTSTPHPSIRHWEGDTVVRGIQEIRSQFVRSETESFPRHHSQPQRPSSRPPLLPVSPPRDAATRTVRPTWPLFHRSGGRGRGRHQVQEEEDVWIDIEKVSPPRTTYHLYRLSADGTSSALPITVIPSFTTSLHSMNPTSHGAHGLLVDHRDFPPQNRAAVTPRRQLHPLVVTKAQQSHFSNSRFMEHQTTSFQASQQLDDSSLVRHPSSNRFHKKPLVFTVPQEQKTGTPAEATENVVSLEDDDIELMSNGEVDLIEISSDSSPEVNCGALKIKSTCDGESHSSQVLAAASQANLCKGSRRSSFSVNANSSKLLTSKDEELPDLTCAQSSTKLPSEDDSKVEDNLSDVSTIFFEEMHFDEWMNDVMENMTTSTSSSGSTEVVPSTSLVDASASHNQTERNITMVNDNNEMVALLCAEQCTNLTTGEKGCDAVKQIVINHPPETEDKSKEWPAGHSDTTPHQDVQSDQDTRSTSDKRIIGDNKVREAAPVHHAHDENTKLTKEDDKKQITNAVREAEPVHYAHSENIKVTDEDNIRYITNDPLQAKLEDGITSEKYDVAAMENGAVEEVPLEVTQSKISKEETASQEANELPVTAIGLSGTNNMSISNTFNHACMTRKMNMDSAPQNYPITAVVGEVRSSPSWSTKEEGADTARNLLENDKALEEPTTLACGSEKKRKQIVKTKVKKRKRRSTKLKEVQRLETTWRRHDGDDEDCLQVIDPSCTLFVSDGQLVVAMEVPTCTPNENANAIEKSGETEMPPQHSIRSPLPSDFLHLHISSPLQSPTAIAVNPKGMSNACEMNEHQSTKSETGDAITSLLHVSNLEGKEQANKEQGEADEGHAKSVKETQTYEEHGVSKDVDLKHNDVPVVMRTKEEKHLVQGSRECNTASEEYLVAMPPQGINIKIMKNISVDSVPDSCPPLSVSNFAKKAAMKINQLCGESNVLRLQQDGRGLPVEFSHIVEDFMNTVHCEREVQEKQVGTALPVGNNMIQSLDSEQHSADGKVEGSYFSSRGTDPLPSMNCTQPVDCEIHSAICMTREAKSGAQPLEREQPPVSETHPSVSWIQLAVCKTQPAICNIQPEFRGIQPVECVVQPVVCEMQPAVSETHPSGSGTQPEACDIHLAVCETQPAHLVEPNQQLVERIQHLMEPNQQLLESSQQLVEPSQQLMEPSQRLVKLNQQLVEPNQQLVEPNQQLVKLIQHLVEPSQQLVEPNQQLVEPSQQLVEPNQHLQSAGPSHWYVGPNHHFVGLSQRLVISLWQFVKPSQLFAGPSQQFVVPSQGFMAHNQCWSLQSSEVNPSPASEAQPPDLNHGSDVAKERKKRCRDESADEESEVEGSRGRKRRKKARVTTHHHIVEVSLTERYMECLRMVAMAGEAFLSPLRGHGVMRPSHGFASLQPEHTRSLLNQMVRSMRGRCQSASDEKNSYYKNLLALHGLIKAGDLLLHCGLEPALRCLDQFHHTHHVLLAEHTCEVGNPASSGSHSIEVEQNAGVEGPRRRTSQGDIPRGGGGRDSPRPGPSGLSGNVFNSSETSSPSLPTQDTPQAEADHDERSMAGESADADLDERGMPEEPR
ncbi:hypothetical protein O3P69_001058 [Scylla paramamosain]|uniref:AP2/ERF domain-containing protein n=1 Tax=Scylla paramamosain TaxID=85552 RepID=A0AAW0UNE4_SCYPA